MFSSKDPSMPRTRLCPPKARVSRLDGVLWVDFGSELKGLETERFLDRRGQEALQPHCNHLGGNSGVGADGWMPSGGQRLEPASTASEHH